MRNTDTISDQLIAAFLDGNATPEETRTVLSALPHDAGLREVLSVVTRSGQISDLSPYPMQSMAAANTDNLCAFLSELYILRQRGLNLDSRTLLQQAQDNRWVTDKGTPLHSVGCLLASQGLMITRRYDATMDDILAALQNNNEVIAAVDNDKLYPNRPDPEDAPDHMVVVRAVDQANDCITLFEPQVGDVMDFSLSDFLKAWHESRNYMIRVLRSADDYEPHPLNLDDVPLTEDLLELREAIAENAHEVWAAARKKEGWTYGSVRDDTRKHHPDLIPYSALPDTEKDYDRLMAINTIKLLKKLGWEIVKK